MTTEIPKSYDPGLAETKWFPFWEQRGDFNADPPQPGDPNPKPPYVIMIPLPNVTGALHMGHALNGTLQDLLTRVHRMQGYEALWMPGTDHAGIATQSVVEKRMLEEEGKTRHDIGREELVQRIWRWKDDYEARILSQLKRIGASCDWRRVRFTLDEVCSRAVRQTFFKMFKEGLIFRGKRLVNWDTFLQTAVADDEVYDEEIDGHFWTFNYPVVDAAGNPTGERISFSTTRPETMLGDTAVCVHPTDERYTHLVGKHVQIPVNGRVIPIVADALLADKTLGTGCVKVTPAHDPNDYACWTRNKEKMGEPINILNTDGTLNENGSAWQGLDRLVARDQVVAKMERLGHFEKVEDRKIPLKHSDRSKTPIEPYLSEQWFVKMDTLAQSAMDAANDNRVKFFPERYRQSYLSWLGEKRDWCISRQLWWGHRIPVWSRTLSTSEFNSINRHEPGTFKEFPGSNAEVNRVVGRVLFNGSNAHRAMNLHSPKGFRPPLDSSAHPDLQEELGEDVYLQYSGDPKTSATTLRVCVRPGASPIEESLELNGFTREEDVLDTWFSSALWPHATLGWPDLEHNPPAKGQDPNPATGKNEVLSYFYPGSVLVTSRDIITLWVARMVLTGLYNMHDVPFRHVCIHPKIQDGFGQTMSKSKGNGVDPIELIEKYGCDGMRFTIASFAGETQDVRLPVGYECPHCQAVIPQELHHLKFKPGKPKIKCAKCKKESQYATPNYMPDDGEPVARIVIERFEYGRNFCNKLWNAARFAMLNLEGYTPGTVDVGPDNLTMAIEDRWVLSRLATVTEEVTSLLSVYKFDAATRSLRDFVWNEFCDWYLEMIKPRLRDESQKPQAQRVLVAVLDTILRLLHPFTPFITEDLWQRLKEIAPVRGLPSPQPVADAVIIALWPANQAGWRDAALESRFQRLQDLIVAVRNVRGTYNISPAVPVSVCVRCSPEIAADLGQVKAQFELLAKAQLTAAGPEIARPKASVSFSLGDADGYLPLEGLVDLQAEVARLKKETDKLRGFILGSEKKLSNESFVAKAPPEVVDEVRATLAGQRKQLASIEDAIQQLSEA